MLQMLLLGVTSFAGNPAPRAVHNDSASFKGISTDTQESAMEICSGNARTTESRFEIGGNLDEGFALRIANEDQVIMSHTTQQNPDGNHKIASTEVADLAGPACDRAARKLKE
jgi:hypothetical protein